MQQGAEASTGGGDPMRGSAGGTAAGLEQLLV